MLRESVAETRSNGQQNPYLFIVGCPRSGTTLLQRIVDAHPLIAVINETSWIPHWFETRTRLTPEGLVTSKINLELLEYDRMLRFHEGRTRANPKLSAKSAWLPIMVGLRDWRGQMDAAEVERFEAAAGDLLDELSYERVFPSVGAEARKHASMIGDLFTRDTRARGRVLPKRWGDMLS